MELKNFDQLVTTVKGMSEKRVVAVAAAADEHVIESVLEAKKEGVAQPILVGDAEQIKEILRKMDQNPSDFAIEHAPGTPGDAAVAAVELIKHGDANFLMKGMIETSDLLRPVVKRENNLRTGRTMSHLSFNKFDAYHKVIVNTDGGMCTYPDLAKKKEIIINAVETFRTLGYDMPKVACLCCKETVDEKMPETLDARALREACEAGEFGKCFVEGPVSYDIAMSKEIAAQKKFPCAHVEDFDILLQPNIHAGNIMGKCWTVSCHATMAGIVVGAKVPIVLTSRGSSAEEKYLSIALAGMVAALNK
jgi:phosphate butyryltransferase